MLRAAFGIIIIIASLQALMVVRERNEENREINDLIKQAARNARRPKRAARWAARSSP